MPEMPKDQLLILRNLTVDLHSSAGFLITIPTEAAITGQADFDGIKVSMMAYLNLIQISTMRIYQVLGVSKEEVEVIIQRILTQNLQPTEPVPQTTIEPAEG